MLAAVVVSQLSGPGRARHLDAVARQRATWSGSGKTLSRGLLLAEEGEAAPTGSPVTSRMPSSSRVSPSMTLTRARSRAGRTDLPDIDVRLLTTPMARQAITWREPRRASSSRRPTTRPGADRQPRDAGWHDERHGAPVGGPSGRDRPRAGTRSVTRPRPRKRPAAAASCAPRSSMRWRARVRDAADVGRAPPAKPHWPRGDGRRSRAARPIVDEGSARLQGLVSDAIRMLHVEARATSTYEPERL